MTINNTSILKLRQITYMHDGQESADAFNETMTILEGLFSYLIPWRGWVYSEYDGWIDPFHTTSVPMVLDRATGQPIINRLALPY